MVDRNKLIQVIEQEINNSEDASINVTRDAMIIKINNKAVDIDYKLKEILVTDQEKNKFINLIASKYDARRNQNGK